MLLLAQGLQTLGSVALATDKALGEVRREAEAASAAVGAGLRAELDGHLLIIVP